MPEPENFDLEAFQAEVEKMIRVIEGYAELQAPPSRLDAVGTVQSSPNDLIEEVPLRVKVAEETGTPLVEVPSRTLVQDKLLEAEELLTRKGFMQLICPHLQFVADSASEIADAVNLILAPAVLAGAILIPLEALLFAAVAVVLSKKSISKVCAEYIKADK